MVNRLTMPGRHHPTGPARLWGRPPAEPGTIVPRTQKHTHEQRSIQPSSTLHSTRPGTDNCSNDRFAARLHSSSCRACAWKFSVEIYKSVAARKSRPCRPRAWKSRRSQSSMTNSGQHNPTHSIAQDSCISTWCESASANAKSRNKRSADMTRRH